MEYNLETNLNELYKHRRFALVGTLGCVALMATNLTYETDAELTLLMGSVIAFPSFLNYLVDVQTEINKKHTLKKKLKLERNINEESDLLYN